MKQAYSFDDVLLQPKYSDIESRAEVSLSSDLDGNITLSLPVISSPMDTVTETSMSVAMDKSGGLGVIHRYGDIDYQAGRVKDSYYAGVKNVAAAVGMSGDYLERADELVRAGASILCVDVAHGHHQMMKTCVKTLKNKFGKNVHIMAGNVATLEAFNDLASWGADSIRVGIGGGSICSTRLVTGHGIPTFQSVLECANTTYDVKIIADGGIKTTGDMVKAYAAGADFVMLGSMLAGTTETPGEVFVGKEGKKYKIYRGMASANAQNAWRGKSSTPEGVSTTIPFRGSVDLIMQDIAGGIRSGLSYSGARSMAEFRSKASFILQTGAGQIESNTHILWRHK
jgi:IMP dehydrogenase